MDMDDGNDPKYYQNAADKIKKEFQKMAEQQLKAAAQEKVEWDSSQRSNLRGGSGQTVVQDRAKFNNDINKKLLKQQQQQQPKQQQQNNLVTIISSDSEQEDAGEDHIIVDKKILNTDILSKKLNKIKQATKVVKEKVQTQQQLDINGLSSSNTSSHQHKRHKSQIDHQNQDKDEAKNAKRRGISPRNAIRVAFNEESPENSETPPEDSEAVVKHTHRHRNTTIDDSLPKNNIEGYGPTFYNNNMNPAISNMEIKKYTQLDQNEKDNNDLFDNLTGFGQAIPLKREIELCQLNPSFGGSKGLIAIADVKKGVTNIQEGDPQMAKDTLTMVQLQLEKIGKAQEAILGEIKSEIDTLQSENLYLFQSNEKLKAQNNHLLERTVDLTKDLERLKRYVRVKQLEWEKISLARSIPTPKAKGRQSKKSKNPNKDTDIATETNEKRSSRSRRQSIEKNRQQEEFYYDDDDEFDLRSKKSHKISVNKSQKESSKSNTAGGATKKKQESMKYEKNETNCFSFLLGGGRKKRRAQDDNDDDD